MRKLKISSVLLLLIGLTTSYGQVSDKAMNKYANTPNETIYVHHNGSLFFTGEYLFYKVYCLEKHSEKFSRLSKVGYVELIGQDQDVVFRHKIVLEKGKGDSNFFIPNSIPSGNYKLVAYTQWMKNQGVDGYFQSDISIVNPYRGNQLPILNNNSEETVVSIKTSSEMINPIIYKGANGYSEFKLSLNGSTFKRRTEIQLTLENTIRERGFGNYSISVKKIDELPTERNHSAMSYRKEMTKASTELAQPLQYIPEDAGFILTGRVYDMQTGIPAIGKDVAISITGDNFFFKVATTNTAGTFSFSLDHYYVMDSAFLQLVDDNRDNFSIIIDPFEISDYSKVSYASFKISESMEDIIKKRSIYNQIENGYFSVKPDTVQPLPLKKPFTGYERFTRYNLDDYTRFNTMEEVFREIIKAVWTAGDENDKRLVKVFNNEFSAPSNDPPLLFIDGVFVADPNDFLAYNALKVQQVSMIRNMYHFGSKDYQGVILIETISGDYRNPSLGDFTTEVTLFPTQPKKQYYFQNYSINIENSRIPDFRSQLLWEPSVVMTSSNNNFTFFTSDNVGQYEVALEGFTKDGRPVSLRKVFNVVE